jgi:signal transduction histidine kinase
MNPVHPGLFGKLLLVFGLALLPVLGLVLYGFQANLKSQESAILDGQLLTANAIAEQVETLFDSAISFGWAVASMPEARTLDSRRLDPFLKRLALINLEYEAISVFDAKGNNRGYGHATLSPEPRFNIAAYSHFRFVMATNTPVVSNILVLQKPPGIHAIIAAVPIRSDRGRPVGLVTVLMNAAHLAKHYEETRLRAGQAIFVVDRDGLLAFHTLQRVPSPQDIRAFRDLPETREALSGTPVTESRFVSPLAKDVRLAAFVPSRQYRWVVGVTLPRSVALNPVYVGLWRSLAAYAGLMVLSGALAAILTRNFVGPILDLKEAALSLGQGNLTARVKVSTGDELERLGDAFNQMAMELQARETERTQLLLREEAARAEAEAMKKLDKLKSDFVNAVSHELRTPLTSIKGYSEFLEDGLGGVLNPQQIEFVRQIEVATVRLQRLVDDLLDFARLEAGTFKLHCAEADLREKVDEVVESLQPQAQAARLTLKSALPDEGMPGWMDAQRIGQVLTNFINNAIKFTPEGGLIEVQARVDGDRLRCEVRDTGIGIAPDDLPKLFQRFGQLEAGIRKPGGTGLGLSISKAIVEAHGGEVGVESQPGKGSTFWFEIMQHPPAC